MRADGPLRSCRWMNMKRRLLPLSLMLLALPAACMSKTTSPNAGNPLIGDWTSTTPPSAYGAAGCPTHYHFSATTQTLTMAGRDIPIAVTYTVQPRLVTVVMQLRSNSFKFLTPDSVAWTAGGPCTYKRD